MGSYLFCILFSTMFYFTKKHKLLFRGMNLDRVWRRRKRKVRNVIDEHALQLQDQIFDGSGSNLGLCVLREVAVEHRG